MPNSNIVDVSSINSLIASSQSMRTNLDKSHAKIRDGDGAFATVNATSPNQIKLYANLVSLGDKKSPAHGLPTATVTVDFKDIGFTNDPIVVATVVSISPQNVTVRVNKSTLTSAEIIVTAVSTVAGNSFNPASIQLNVIAIGT